MDAATARLDKETKIINEATLNLEKADLFVENYLKQGADILPFAAAPEGNGVTESEGKYHITGWGSFVAEAFGQSINPIFVGDLETLYSWKFTDEANLRADEECDKTGLSSLSGYVLNVDENSINLIDSNTDQIYQVNIADCTMNLANQ